MRMGTSCPICRSGSRRLHGCTAPDSVKDDRGLARRLRESVKRVSEMSPEEREDMVKAQRESWVRANMGWD